MWAVVYVGGRVLVCDGTTAAADAVVLRDGRVAGVGPRAAMVRLAGADAESVDVRGATILPGLVDTHPLTCPLESLPATRVLRTVLGGRVVWDAGAL